MAVLVWAVAPALWAGPSAGLDLARSLVASDEHAQAALEFRRLALESTIPAEQGAFYWMAAHEYWKARRIDQADRLLGQVEDVTPALETEVYLLRGEVSRRRNLKEADFYFGSLADPARPEPVRRAAAKKLAAVRLEAKDYAGAREALAQAPEPQPEALAAVAAYERGRDKSPVKGGLLGLVPGLGYAYSGEYANAARSAILNALCIWGIVEFAEDEAWAGVTVVGFAEFTFYTGSIYGGADSAVRYNRERLREQTGIIESKSGFHPDLGMLPLLRLKFEF